MGNLGEESRFFRRLYRLCKMTNSGDMELVAILDAGSQYGKLIDRRVRELCVQTEILPLDTPASVITQKQFKAIIISGGPGSVETVTSKHTSSNGNSNSEHTAVTAPSHGTCLNYDRDIFDLGVPVLGICYGLHMLNERFGGAVTTTEQREDGQFSVDVDVDCQIFKGLSEKQLVLLTHGDSVTRLAEGFNTVARSGTLVSAIADEQRRLYGVQFHPEVDLTENGRSMLRNFLFGVAGVRGCFTLESRQKQCIDYIRRTAADKTVLMLVSGGVDSAVCAALLHKALGEHRVIALHIDNGFMRLGESDQVVKTLSDIGVKLKVVEAQHRFLNSTTTVPEPGAAPNSVRHLTTPLLCRTTHPEHKRKIIGDTFVNVANEVISELGLDVDSVLLGQGTLRPDLIESASQLASSAASCIKTHHNDTDLVRQLRALGRVIEPLKDFHKDEVRSLGSELGLPECLVRRHPFPGPGLAIRVLCADQPYMAADFSQTQVLLRICADYSSSKQRSHALLNRIDVATTEQEREELLRITSVGRIYSTLLPIQTVGVQGDGRSYSYCAGLSCDSEFEWSDMFTLARLIPRVCHNINRVCFIFGEAVRHQVLSVTPTFLTSSVLSQIREADHIANQVLEVSGHTTSVSQMPLVLLPLHFDRDPNSHQPSCQRSLAIRTFITHDFMTGTPAQPGKHLPIQVVEKLAGDLSGVSGISRVLYDMTAKPPATTEWE